MRAENPAEILKERNRALIPNNSDGSITGIIFVLTLSIDLRIHFGGFCCC
jgi:hypothetical protein